MIIRGHVSIRTYQVALIYCLRCVEGLDPFRTYQKASADTRYGYEKYLRLTLYIYYGRKMQVLQISHYLNWFE